MSLAKLTVPFAYQGGKRRLAAKILDIIQPAADESFYDLCCGSGAVSIELVKRRFPVHRLIMVDVGLWGLFWEMVGAGRFDLQTFAEYCREVPKNAQQIPSFLSTLAEQPPDSNKVYIYLLLQAGAFGGKQIYEDGRTWRNCFFRDVWIPSKTSVRRQLVNPMIMAATLLERVKIICERMLGVTGIQADIKRITPKAGAIVYIDPPYTETTGYAYTFDAAAYAGNMQNRCFVSEGRALSRTAFLLSTRPGKGGISGKRKVKHVEYLSAFNITAEHIQSRALQPKLFD